MNQPDFRQLDEIIDDISGNEKAVQKTAFASILNGEPASIQALSGSTGLAPEAVARAVERLAEVGIVVRDATGAIVGCRGLTLVPSEHGLRMNGRHYFGWCAEDVVGIPAALGADAAVTSDCFHCGREISVEIRQGEVIASSPQDIRLWVAEAQIGRSIVDNT